MGYFWYQLVLGPACELLPYMFASAGITLTAAGVMLLVFLAGFENRTASQGEKKHYHSDSMVSDQLEEVELYTIKPNKKLLRMPYLFPILAAMVIFWTNRFTDQLFLPLLNIHFPPGLHPISLALITAAPVIGLLASLWWRRFLGAFILLSSFLFLLSPSLLLLSHSQLLFLVLYTLNITAIRTIIVVFPFIIVDLYWQKSRGGYWSYLMAVSIYMIDANAFILTGPFRALSLEDGYAVALLSLAAIVFFILSLTVILPKPQDAVRTIAPAAALPNVADIFRKHNLSERETEVALLLAQEGLSNEEMGKRLYISERTIKSHIYQIYRKFGVKKRAAFLAKALNK
jgi:DNA-binding CsgD family transcriptional regulator